LVSDIEVELPYLRARKTSSAKTVGLCIPCKNRLWQLQEALPLNLVHCWPHRDWTTIHVVDFDSNDDTLDFLLTACRAAIDVGLLKVYTSDQLPFWHASIAKNTAHMVAREDILVNVDCDSLVGPDFPVDVVDLFRYHTVLQFDTTDGKCGRIAYPREDFLRLRGYDEDGYPSGSQDVDMLERMKMLPGSNKRRVRLTAESLSQSISNTLQEKIEHCDTDKFYGVNWNKMDACNREIFGIRREHDMIVRNVTKKNIGVPCALVMPEAPSCS